MEARGYDPRAKRSKYRRLVFSWRDAIGLLFGLAVFGGVLYLFIYDHNIRTLDLFMEIFKINVGF